ncbi:MAG: hypothetical protein ACR2IV_00430 [Bryobacteraceae bacterium]
MWRQINQTALPGVIQLPSLPGRIAHKIECWQSATSIDLVVRTRQIAPALGLNNRSMTKPVQPIPIRGSTTPKDDSSPDFSQQLIESHTAY